MPDNININQNKTLNIDLNKKASTFLNDHIESYFNIYDRHPVLSIRYILLEMISKENWKVDALINNQIHLNVWKSALYKSIDSSKSKYFSFLGQVIVKGKIPYSDAFMLRIDNSIKEHRVASMIDNYTSQNQELSSFFNRLEKHLFQRINNGYWINIFNLFIIGIENNDFKIYNTVELIHHLHNVSKEN